MKYSAKERLLSISMAGKYATSHELEQLSSEDIKHVELITNPGARYDATVNAVVRIQTIRRTGDGFGFNLNSSYYQSENVDLVEQGRCELSHNGWICLPCSDMIRWNFVNAPMYIRL